jgi:cytochrome c biogenesis protein CcmG/thiol:disulfide interchange protein DsbE
MIGRLLPIALFLALGLLLAAGLQIADHKTEIPSPLIGKPMPDFTLPVLGQEGLMVSSEDLLGKPFLLNVWASWCPTCRYEHPVITSLAESGALRVIGLNYRDEAQDAQQWLQRFGDPYEFSLADLSGRTGIDFGVYAAPESFLIDAEGIIVFKQIGVVTEDIIRQEILPRIQQ